PVRAILGGPARDFRADPGCLLRPILGGPHDIHVARPTLHPRDLRADPGCLLNRLSIPRLVDRIDWSGPGHQAAAICPNTLATCWRSPPINAPKCRRTRLLAKVASLWRRTAEGASRPDCCHPDMVTSKGVV